MIIKYLREKKEGEVGRGKPIGIVVALDKTRIGFSLCNPLDQWDRKKAKTIAIGRANKYPIAESLADLTYTTNFKPTPRHDKLKDAVKYVKELAEKYDFNR